MFNTIINCLTYNLSTLIKHNIDVVTFNLSRLKLYSHAQTNPVIINNVIT